jgi:hypothetical protein
MWGCFAGYELVKKFRFGGLKPNKTVTGGPQDLKHLNRRYAIQGFARFAAMMRLRMGARDQA